MSQQQFQMVAWTATICSCIIAAIVNRNHLKEFFGKWKWIFVAAFILLGVLEGCLYGWFNWLVHPFTLPVWVLIILGVVGLAIVAGLFYFFGKISDVQPGPEVQDPLNYRIDEIFGVEWTWNYIYGQLNENNLSAFCPRQDCKCRLESELNHNARVNVNSRGFPISLVCPRYALRRDFDTDWERLKRNVLVEVERRIRTGEYKQRLIQSKT